MTLADPRDQVFSESAEPGFDTLPAVQVPSRDPRTFRLPVAVLIVSLVVTGALVVVSQRQYARDERHLLRLRVHDAGALLTAALPDIQSELASAAELADATDGNAGKFRRFALPWVSGGAGRQFLSVSLWRAAAPGKGPVAMVGLAPKLAASQATVDFARAESSGKLGIIGLLTPPWPRLGYAFATPGETGGLGSYAASRLPNGRRSAIGRTSAFAGLDYALYLGRTQSAGGLLLTSQARLPLTGEHESVTVPFGTSALTLVMSSRRPLAGSLSERLPWVIAIVGALLAVGASAGALRLTERRRAAETLARQLEVSASQNRRLYAQQRNIAQTLQHALLPDRLPEIPGVQTSAQYRAGERGVDIGGDWYDVIDLGDRRLLLVVGDVSGKGLPAATTMATLRYAIHAYAAQNDSPAMILTKLSDLLSVTDRHQIATILCVVVNLDDRAISVTSAGHLPPLLIDAGRAEYAEVTVGLPVGVETGASYRSTTIPMAPGATLLAFTDGLVEHREDLERGLSRLRHAATSADDADLPEFVGGLMEQLSDAPSPDDSVLLGLRWTD